MCEYMDIYDDSFEESITIINTFQEFEPNPLPDFSLPEVQYPDNPEDPLEPPGVITLPEPIPDLDLEIPDPNLPDLPDFEIPEPDLPDLPDLDTEIPDLPETNGPELLLPI